MRYSERKIRNGKVCAGLFAAVFSVLFSVSFIGMRLMLCTVFCRQLRRGAMNSGMRGNGAPHCFYCRGYRQSVENPGSWGIG